MQEPYPYYDLLGDFCRIILLQVLTLLDKLKQILAVDQFSHDVYVRLGLNALFELQEQRMRNDLHDTALVPQYDHPYAIRFLASAYNLNVAIYLIAYYLFYAM